VRQATNEDDVEFLLFMSVSLLDECEEEEGWKEEFFTLNNFGDRYQKGEKTVFDGYLLMCAYNFIH